MLSLVIINTSFHNIEPETEPKEDSATVQPDAATDETQQPDAIAADEVPVKETDQEEIKAKSPEPRPSSAANVAGMY